MGDYYSRNYLVYHENTFFAGTTPLVRALTARLAPGSHVLDVGCGSGRDLRWLKKQGYAVTGFERSAGLARLARRNAGCKVVEGDFERFDFSSLRVDAVLLSGALVHLPPAAVLPVFQNVVRALGRADRPDGMTGDVKPDPASGESLCKGLVCVSLKEGHGIRKHPDGRVFYLWQDEDARRLFTGCGFVVVDFGRSRSRLGTDEIWLGYVLAAV